MGMFDDPDMMAYLGLMQGLGKASAPSRLPVTNGMAIGDAAEGLMGGIGAGQQQRLAAQEIAGKRLGNVNSLITLNIWRKAMGQPELTEADLAGATGSSPGGSPQENGPARAARMSAPFGMPSGSGEGVEADPDAAPGAPGSAFTSDPEAPGAELRPAMRAGMLAPPASPGVPVAPSAGAAGAMPGGAAPMPAPMGMPMGGAGSGPGAGNFMGLRLPQGMGPLAWLTLSRLNPSGAGRVMANQYPGPTDYERARDVAAATPDDPLAREAAAKAAGINVSPDLRPGGVATIFNPKTFKYEPAYQQPALPEGTIYQNGRAVPVPGADDRLAAVEGVKQTAAGNKDIRVADAAARRELGDLSPPALGAPGGAGATETPSARLNKALAPKGPGLTEPLTTTRGTTLPPVSEQSPLPTGTKQLEGKIADWNKTATDWTTSLKPSLQAEQRLTTIAQMYKLTESGTFATQKADIAAGLKGLGITVSDKLLGDPAAVQLALHENAVKTLSTLKEATSRFTQMEFKTLSGQTEHPDLQPAANLQQLSEDIAMLRQSRNVGYDFRDARRFGWKDPQDFEAAWHQANPLDRDVEAVKKEIGPLRGMPGGPGKENDPLGIR